MTKHLLLPRQCRLIGIVLLPFMIFWLIATYSYDFSLFPFLRYNLGVKTQGFFPPGFVFDKNFSADFNGEISFLFTLICLFMIAFSKEKNEDEYIRSLRLQALQVSVYVSYLILAIASTLIYGVSFFLVTFLNIFTILIVFIIVFHYNLHMRSRIRKTEAI